MNPYLQVFLSVLLVFGFSTNASECDFKLRPSLSLPRELKITPEAAEFLLQDEHDSALLSSFSNIFSALKQPELSLDEIADGLRVQPDAEEIKQMPLPQSALFQSLKESELKSIQNVFINLYQSPIGLALSADDLGLLAYLLKDMPQIPSGLQVRIDPATPRIGAVLNTTYQQRVLNLLADRRSRLAISDFLFELSDRSLFKEFNIPSANSFQAFAIPDLLPDGLALVRLAGKCEKGKLDSRNLSELVNILFLFLLHGGLWR